MKNSDEMSAEERMAEITSLFATAFIRLIESGNYQGKNLHNERSCTRLPSHSKRSCVHQTNKERTDDD